ncbi:hypothetical protein [Pararobbsia alpina]|uniref:Uncharacterized protein n=1 Tax=Pararobbsia alpina TaxID=621374 RepID=A0A6S7C2D2_9BURK|nr:hypothetical protein [Pararobbsia alpina]CAB3799742.1 hypothetical protein LMG28138_04700 [Pararobbsia alpina]
MKILGWKRLASACAASVLCGLLVGVFVEGRQCQTGATLSLLASIENKGRRNYSDRYRINISENTYVICAEAADESERMCSKGEIRIGRRRVDLLEQNFTRFSGGVPVSKGSSTAHWRFEILFQSDKEVVIYSPLEGVFVLKKTV